MDVQRTRFPSTKTLPTLASFVPGNWHRYLVALLLVLTVQSPAAFAADTYFLYLDQTGQQTQIDTDHTSSCHIVVATGASFDLGGGKFAMKKGSKASADVVLKLYEGSNISGTVLATATVSVGS